jgi:glycosyltransferase involved in cell wall biosynthesis
VLTRENQAVPAATVSVVIPTFNCGRFVTEAVESVLAQTVVPAEVIVIDDGSTDDTPTRLARYAWRVRYVRQSNQGVSEARNHGVRLALGDYIAFLDADDVWHPRKLELQLEVLARRPDLGLLGTSLFAWPATAFADLRRTANLPLTPVTWERLVAKNWLVTSTILARADVLRQAGPFDSRLQGPEDHDMWIRVAELTATANLTLPLTGYRYVPTSLSKQARRMEDGMRQILQKLEARGAFKRRSLLRRRAYSVLNHRCAFMYAQAGETRVALKRSIRALVEYPLPFCDNEVDTPLERVKRLVRNLLALGRGGVVGRGTLST